MYLHIPKHRTYILLIIAFIWLPNILLAQFSNREAANCPSIKPNRGILLFCKYFQNVTTDCSMPSNVGTIAEYRCNQFYRPLWTTAIPKQLICNSNGVWANFRRFQEYFCEVDCGKPVRPHTPLIALGQDTLRFSWPWHATIFIWRKKTSQYHYICGGSLISENVILTAAHCLVTNPQIPLEMYLVKLGAISSNSTENESDLLVQSFRVKNIFTPPEYDSHDYRSDIGIMELNRSVLLTNAVSPVCFPYDDDFAKPAEPEVIGEGEVVGYGKNEEGLYQQHLKYTRLPVVGAAKCYEVLQKTQGREQYCAGIQNGSAVCPGDSGGGMVFKGQGISRYYVQGIVSNSLLTREKVTCDGLAYFTNVIYFSRWVANIVNSVQENQENSNVLTLVTETPVLVQTFNTVVDVFNSSLSLDGADICEYTCSYVTNKNDKYSLKGTENALEFFEGILSSNGNCTIVCFELDYVELIPETLLKSIEDCKELQSICITNLKVTGRFIRKVELPKLREFKQSSVEIGGLYSRDDIYSLIFFKKSEEDWAFEDVTKIDTNIEIRTISYFNKEFQPLYIHRRKRKLVLRFSSCNDVLVNRDPKFELEDLSLTDCTFLATSIPNTLYRLSLANFKIQQGSLATMVRRQTNLIELQAATKEKSALEISQLPRKLKKIYCAFEVKLKSSGVFDPMLGVEEIFLGLPDEGIVNNFAQLFPNVRQVGLVGNNLKILEQSLKMNYVNAIGGAGWIFCTSCGGITEKEYKIFTDSGIQKTLITDFILQRNSSNVKWTGAVSTENEVEARFWFDF